MSATHANELLDQILALCGDIPRAAVEDHIGRLDERYCRTFTAAEISAHVRAAARLSPERPVEVVAGLSADGLVSCTIIAPDYPAAFSLIAGSLTSSGLNILSGEVFTYRRSAQRMTPAMVREWASRRESAPVLPDRRIVDHFAGRLADGGSVTDWADALTARLGRVFSLLQQGDAGRQPARQMVNELVATRLQMLGLSPDTVLLPMELSVSSGEGPFTHLRVAGQDTPAFLYSLSSALSSQGLSIERVTIKTLDGAAEDDIDLLDQNGSPVADPLALARIKLSALLTKQFTYFLGRAPDPYGALVRFEQMVADIVRLPEQGRWVEILSNHRILQDLARLLGASEYIWEDVVRAQYETLLPMLEQHVHDRRFAGAPSDVAEALAALVRSQAPFAERVAELNRIKDREIFLIDLDHIVTRKVSIRGLSTRLTALAEQVVNAMARMTFDELVSRHGRPLTIAGIETEWAAFGLGKLGGVELGYASDIELLFVYSDNGDTEGPNTITNAEFFEHFVDETVRGIHAKREGIFTIDLRLRPWGSRGPRACSLENFCRYYGPGGEAHAYERLALVRLRAIGGNPAFGARVERLRDEFIYAPSDPIDLSAIRDLRRKQFTEKNRPGSLNAKYSPGTLVDLEYDVQILQAMHGRDHPGLRTPRTHDALRELGRAGVLDPDEYARLDEAYDFLRGLVNGLRMLRGSARDLYLPPLESSEYTHLARRMGYERDEGLPAAEQLHADFEMHTAAVRLFIERHFGRDSLPGEEYANIADIVLADKVPEEAYTRVLAAAGFADPRRAYQNLRAMARDGESRVVFARLAVLASDMLRDKPDPDMALNNWERFTSALARRTDHFADLLSQPKRLDLLLSVMSASQFLADTLIRHPEFLDWVTRPENVNRSRTAVETERELTDLSGRLTDRGPWLNAVRLLRKREILRIGMRDICLRAPIEEVTADISALAAGTIEAVYRRIWDQVRRECGAPLKDIDLSSKMCVLALGKLGGGELNYSSDIDLVFAAENGFDLSAQVREGETILDICSKVITRLRADLSDYTEEGYVFRADLRLRPYGRTGMLVYTVDALREYYEKQGSPWELQALLKLWPVAGNLDIGRRLLDAVRGLLMQAREPEAVLSSIRSTRAQAVKRAAQATGARDIKNGEGGIRDIEFVVQGLQLVNLRRTPSLLERNTLRALAALRQAEIIDADLFIHLREDYVFLRRAEHFLQLFYDLQTHQLPSDEAQLGALARRLLGVGATADDLTKRLSGTFARTQATFRRFVGDPPAIA